MRRVAHQKDAALSPRCGDAMVHPIDDCVDHAQSAHVTDEMPDLLLEAGAAGFLAAFERE